MQFEDLTLYFFQYGVYAGGNICENGGKFIHLEIMYPRFISRNFKSM